MQVINEVGTDSKEQDTFFASLDPNAPLVMISLLKFKEKDMWWVLRRQFLGRHAPKEN